MLMTLMAETTHTIVVCRLWVFAIYDSRSNACIIYGYLEGEVGNGLRQLCGFIIFHILAIAAHLLPFLVVKGECIMIGRLLLKKFR